MRCAWAVHTATPGPTEDRIPADTALAASGLTKLYGSRPAVDGLSFAIPIGSVCGFVGPNGAGKTTTIRMLLGLARPSHGTATVLGHSIDEPSAYLPRVGAMIEGPAFHPGLSGSRNLAMLAAAGSLPSSRVAEVLAVVGLANRASSPVRSYSLGMKQRLGIAAALLPDPDLLILDEPTNGLDPAGIAELRDLLRRLAEGGRTVFVSSHILAEIEQIAGHLLLLQQGKLLFSGPIAELLAAQQPHTIAVPHSADDMPRLRHLIQDLGLPAAPQPDGALRIRSDRSALINRTAYEAGVCLAGIYVVRPSLEDAFFALTDEDRSPVEAMA